MLEHKLKQTFLCDIECKTTYGKTFKDAYYVECWSEALDWLLFDHKINLNDVASCRYRFR